jgi:hypothetical protein
VRPIHHRSGRRSVQGPLAGPAQQITSDSETEYSKPAYISNVQKALQRHQNSEYDFVLSSYLVRRGIGPYWTTKHYMEKHTWYMLTIEPALVPAGKRSVLTIWSDNLRITFTWSACLPPEGVTVAPRAVSKSRFSLSTYIHNVQV